MPESRRMVDSNSSDDELLGYLERVAEEQPRDARTAAAFARVLAESGEHFTLPLGRTADVASTGGPSSLSTLICPLYLRAGGFHVPKLGVPGRPAGGVDCLAQIPGYITELSNADLFRVMERCGYAHFTASGRFAPLDARVFRLRQLHDLQEVPTLVAASLLSKKLAVGVATAGLDIRVAPHGNFGRDFEDARLNAAMYEEAASMLGIEGRPVLTDGRSPYQPYIGRSEALAALAALFGGSLDPWLEEHFRLCRTLSAAAAPSDAARIATVTPQDLQATFLANLVAQGAREDGFQEAAARVHHGHTTEIVADRHGVACVSLGEVREALVAAQAAQVGVHPYPDPAGVILRQRPGDHVRCGDTLATVRVDAPRAREYVLDRLKSAICAIEGP